MYVQLICKIKTSYLENCRISYPYNIGYLIRNIIKKIQQLVFFTYIIKIKIQVICESDIFTIDLQHRSYPYKRGTLLATARQSFNDIKNINDIKYSITIFFLRKTRLKLFQSNFQTPKLYTNILFLT